MFNTVAIIGLGLLGGSFALDLRQLKLAKTIIGYDLDTTHRENALEKKLVDQIYSRCNHRLNEADLIMIAVPVGSINQVIDEIHTILKSTKIVSDVGSVKSPCLKYIDQNNFQNILFVGGHPIAGSETFGPLSARKGLFKNKKCILTPIKSTDPLAFQTIKDLWTLMGCNVLEISPQLHDQIYAIVSHLPHFLASAAVDSIGKEDLPDLMSYYGEGFRDFSRIAASNPLIWVDIFMENQPHLLKCINHFRDSLDGFIMALENKNYADLTTYLTDSKKIRDSWIQSAT